MLPHMKLCVTSLIQNLLNAYVQEPKFINVSVTEVRIKYTNTQPSKNHFQHQMNKFPLKL